MRWFLVGICVLSVITSCRRRAEYTTGDAVFHGECVKCHKLNGLGGTKGPELTQIFEKKDEQYIRTYVMDPRSIKGDGTMPPAKISDQELNLVIEYLKKRGSAH
jgi:mono/diheme cytochrome c family protein